MKSRALMMLAIFLGLLLFLGNISWAGGRTGQRQEAQSKRISHGVVVGQITDREFARLHQEQRRIDHYRNLSWADGYMNPRERRRPHKMQDGASEHIYPARHNHVSDDVRPAHKHLHIWLRPVYHEYYAKGTVSEPVWSFGWALGCD